MSTRPVWFAATLVFLFAAVFFPLRTERLNRGLEGVFVAPDAMARYDARTLAETFSVLAGAQQPRRLAYARSELTLDVAFPVAYVSFFVLLLLAIYPGPGAAPGGQRGWRLVATGVPTAAGLADLVENLHLARVARRDAWERWPGDLERIATDIASPAHRAALATGLKRGLLLAVLGLIVIALLRSGRLGKLVTLLWLVRLPVLGLGAPLALAALGGGDRVSPTIPNMLALDHWGQVFAAAGLASAAAILAGFSLLLIWELAPLRVAARLPDMPAFLATREAADPLRNAVFIFFALPLVLRTVVRSSADLPRAAAYSLAAVGGIGAAVGVLWLVKSLRKLCVRWTPGALARLLGVVARRLGPGYESPAESGRFLDGHGLAAALAGVMVVIYFAGQRALDPGRFPELTAAVPTLGYLLGLVAILGSLLAGATFFFDRWRVPIVAIAVLWVAVVSQLRPIEHEFAWSWSETPLPAANRAAEARLGQGPPRVLTVVTASGGGIQAAAWTARVLTGLQEELGAGFTRSIGLVSAVSGGSVGTYFALSAFADQGADRGALRGEALEAVFAAAAESSLEPTAWGLLYPDLLRALVPGMSSTRDRGWAMERGWLRAVRVHGLDPAGRRQEFSDWVRDAADGALPAVVLNATRIDDGMPLRLATVGPRDETGHGSPDGHDDAPLVGLAPDFTYRRQEPVTGHLALAAVTAARLSAAFPYISPIARPRYADEPNPLRFWHAADGGYFDNHGTVAALAWLYELQRAWGEDLATHVDRVVWVQIDAFPDTDPGDLDHDPGWTMSAIGPLKGLLRVRVAGQRVRRAAEVAIEQQLQGPRLTVAILRPARRTGPHREAPLSWALGRRDVEAIAADWRAIAASGELAALRAVFGAPAATASPSSAPAAASPGASPP